MKRLIGIMTGLFMVFMIVFCAVSGAEEETGETGGGYSVPLYGLKAGMSFGEIREEMADRGLVCIRAPEGVQDDETIEFSFEYTGDMTVCGLQATTFHVSVAYPGVMDLWYSFYGRDAERMNAPEYSGVPLYADLNDVYDQLEGTIRDFLGPEYPILQTGSDIQWGYDGAYFILDKANQRAPVVRLQITLFEERDDTESPEPEAAVRNTVEGNMKTYCEMTDGTWTCDGRVYQYRLEIKGRMPNAAADSFFVYLSNIPEITFDQAYKAAGISSSSDDYFPPEKAVLVEMN